MEWDPHSLHCTFGFTIPAGIVQNLAYHFPKKSILFLRRKFRVFCTKNQLCFGVFEQENHFNWCWAPNGICFMNLSLSGWDFGSEALTRLLTCISVPDGALYSHPLSCHGGGSAHKGKFDVLKCTWLQVSKGWKSRGIAWVLKICNDETKGKIDIFCLRSPLLLKSSHIQHVPWL